jgi:hypothetical protein
MRSLGLMIVFVQFNTFHLSQTLYTPGQEAFTQYIARRQRLRGGGGTQYPGRAATTKKKRCTQ